MTYNSQQRRARLILLASVTFVAVVLYSSQSESFLRRKANAIRVHSGRKFAGYSKDLSTILRRYRVFGTGKVPCDDECLLFRSRLEVWPTDRPKGIIYYLAAGRTAVDPLRSSVEALQRYFNNRFRYPIVVFIDATLNNEEDRRKIHDMVPPESGSIYVQVADFKWLPGLDTRSKSIRANVSSALWRPKISRVVTHWFHIVGVYDQPLMHSPGLQYVMHMASRLILTDHVKHDLFQFMHDHRMLYGHSGYVHDSSVTDVGLWNAVTRYVSGKHTQASHFDQWNTKNKGHKHIFTDFEIYSLAIWMSSEYRDYVAYIERYEGLTHRKWNPVTIRTIAVTLLTKRSQVHHFTDLVFYHSKGHHRSETRTLKPTDRSRTE